MQLLPHTHLQYRNTGAIYGNRTKIILIFGKIQSYVEHPLQNSTLGIYVVEGGNVLGQ
jgi:hypothetical protein